MLSMDRFCKFQNVEDYADGAKNTAKNCGVSFRADANYPHQVGPTAQPPLLELGPCCMSDKLSDKLANCPR
jgi:hypothetical protein